MSRIAIYIDEDAMDGDLAAALRSRGVTAITPLDAGLAEKPDEEQLAFAQQRFSVGEQLRRILRLRATATMESMSNRAGFLANWG